MYENAFMMVWWCVTSLVKPLNCESDTDNMATWLIAYMEGVKACKIVVRPALVFYTCI